MIRELKKAYPLIVGCFLGTLAFWIAVLTVLPFLPSALLYSAQGIVLADRSAILGSSLAPVAIEILQREGLGLSADGFIGRITDFYGVVLQIALAAFVLFGFVSYLAIRWQSVQAAEEMSQSTMRTELESEKFNQRLHEMIASDLAVDQVARQLSELSQMQSRVEAIEGRLADMASDEEPAEPGPEVKT